MILGYLVYTQFEAKRNSKFIDILLNSAKNRNISLKVLIYENIEIHIGNKPEILYNKENIEIPRFVILRVMGYRIYEMFEKLGVRTFNSSKISYLFDNKFNAYKRIKNMGIDILDTKMVSKGNFINENITFPIVTKPIDSKGGDRVVYNVDALSLNDSIKKYDDKFIVQRPSDVLGKDLRVYVIGKEIITSILRISKNNFLSTYCKGGIAELYTLNNDELNIVNKIINNFDFDYVGIDFLFNKNGIVFSEIENVVGARMVYNLTDIDIGDKFIEYVSKNYE